MNLYEAIQTTTIGSVVDDWISAYQENSKSAMLKIFQLLIQSCGFKKIISPSELEAMHDYAILLETMINEIPEGRDAPISAKPLRCCLGEFFLTLIARGDHLLYDDILLDYLLSVLAALSNARIRVFRYVGTFVAMKCVTALLQIQKKISKNLPILRQQLTAEQSKVQDRLSQGRLDSLNNSISDMASQENRLEDLLQNYAVKMFLKPRMLDKMPEIQVFCLSELSVWMQLDPDSFMTEKYLSYYNLHLRGSSVLTRLECLQCLRILYEAGRYADKLLGLTRTIKIVLELLTKDESIGVAMHALEVLVIILKTYGQEELSRNFKVEEIFYLVFCRKIQLAKLAGVFLVTWMQQSCLATQRRSHAVASARDSASAGASTSSFSSSTSSFGQPHPGSMVLEVAEFILESRKKDLVEYLVEILLPHCPALKNWNVAAALLLRGAEEVVEDAQDFSPETEECLVRVVTAAVRIMCSGFTPRKQPPAAKNAGKKVMALRAQQRQGMTEAFLPNFAGILQRFITEEDTLILLLGIVEHFTLEFMTPKYERSLGDVTKMFGKIFEVHCNEKVLTGCCEVINHIKKDLKYNRAQFSSNWQLMEFKIFGVGNDSLKRMNLYFEKQIAPDEDHLLNLSNCLKKIFILMRYRNLFTDDLWDDCLYYFQRAGNHSTLPIDITYNLVKICHLNLLDNMKKLNEINIQEIEREKRVTLESKCSQFLSVLVNLMNHNDDELKNLAFYVLCDVLQVFAEDLSNQSTRKVSIKVKDSLQESLRKYVETHAFKRPASRVKVSRGEHEHRAEILKAYVILFSSFILNLEHISWLSQYSGKKYKEYKSVLNEVSRHFPPSPNV